MSHVGSVGPLNKTGNVLFSDVVTSGTLTLNGATPVVVPATSITATSKIHLGYSTPTGTASGAFVSAVSAGVSFSVTAAAGNTSVIPYFFY